eukprot:jgi/Tetstr1/422362/TSEL_013202.t1
MPADEDSSVVPLRIKDFKQLPLHNAKKATGTLVWWLQAKAQVSSKPGFDEFWTTDTSPQHHATFVSILNQIVLDKQARTKRLRFTNSTDPTTEDLTDYENRLNLVRMELECMDKAPDESTLIVAFIKGLRDEFRRTAAHRRLFKLLSTNMESNAPPPPSRPRGDVPICKYCDKCGHTMDECFKRQRDIK